MPDETIPVSDYDGAWKELLESYLEAILRCLFPAVAAEIDWSYPPEYLEQDLRTILGNEEPHLQRVDELIKVRTLDGGSQWVLIHLEVQSFQEDEFEKRIYRYSQALQLAYHEDVVTLVILADLNPSWLPCRYSTGRWGCSTTFQFVTCKLLSLLPSLEEDQSIPAFAARMQIEGLRVRDPELRYEARWRIMEALARQGHTLAEATAIYRAMLRMFRLPESLVLRFRRAVIEWRKENEMPFVGELEEYFTGIGEERGKTRLTVKLLERVCGGPIPQALKSRVETLPTEKVEQLALDLLEFEHLKDLENWLQRESA